VLSDLEVEGYATRPFIVPACGVDAPHKRDRIWIIAKNMADPIGSRSKARGGDKLGADDKSRSNQRQSQSGGDKVIMADTKGEGLEGRNIRGNPGPTIPRFGESGWTEQNLWLPEPGVGRVANGIPRRVDRLKGLGNAIVPQIAMRIGQTIKEESNGKA